MTQPGERRFIRACRRQPVDRVPIWMMRQAGRFQREYRALKDRAGGFWGLCSHAEHIAEATLFAQRSLGTDAAIIFSDITMPSWAMGLELEFAPGPKFKHPVRSRTDVDALRDIEPAKDVPFLLEGIEKTRAGLTDDISLIGFVGAPATLAGYMIEGYPSRNWIELKKMVVGEPELFAALLDRLVDAVVVHAEAQVAAGCDSLQLFDSSAGQLVPGDLERFAFASAQRVIEGLRARGVDVPIIYFARDIGAHFESAAAIGADVIGVDWTMTIASARERTHDGVALQGNLDPATLFCEPAVITARVRQILEQARGAPGFIFNLGHGILPETPPAHAKLVVDVVHQWRWKAMSGSYRNR